MQKNSFEYCFGTNIQNNLTGGSKYVNAHNLVCFMRGKHDVRLSNWKLTWNIYFLCVQVANFQERFLE